jgi:hypothetical protein
LTKKRAEIPDEVRRVLDAPAPDIAGPDDPAWYVEQCGFVICWFKEMFERVGSDDKKLAGGARVALRNLLFSGVAELTVPALDNNNSSAQWARSVLPTLTSGLTNIVRNLVKRMRHIAGN